MSFMDEARENMEHLREEAHDKLANKEPDADGVVRSDDGTTEGTSWSESSVEVHETP